MWKKMGAKAAMFFHVRYAVWISNKNKKEDFFNWPSECQAGDDPIFEQIRD